MAMRWIILSSCLFMHQASGSIINLALRKPVSVSSRYDNRDPGLAVDGNTFAVDPTGVIHTDVNQPFAWWWVDLQTKVQDATVMIYFRIDYKVSRNGVKLYTSTTPFNTYPSGDLCYTVTGRPDGTDIPDIVSVYCSDTWRYLMVYTNTDNSGKGYGPMLDFGEVEVLACSNETYGLNCTKSCSARQCSMTSTTCNRYNGTCPGGCRAGWMGTDCTQACPRGIYGANCVKSCSARQCRTPSSSCDHETGQCPDGCKDGWTGEDCTDPCPVGSHGPDCTLTCGNCSGSDVCDHETGKCPGHCNAGWRGSQCKQPCDREHYGLDCSGECITRHCEGASTCSPSTGQCDGVCETGWSGADCTELEVRSSEVDRTPMVAGTVAAGVVIIILIVVVIGVMWRRRRSKSNDVDASVKVKEDASTEIADHSVQMGEYDSIDMSRDTGSPYTTIDSVDNKDNQASVGVANTMSDINERDEYEPVIDRTYEKLDTPSADSVYTALQGHSSYENLKGRDK